MTLPPPGWHRDPHDAAQSRWWDGAAWTEHVRPEPAPRASLLEMLAAAGRFPAWAWMLIGVVALVMMLVLPAPFMLISLVVLVTGIVALVRKTPTWLRLSGRGATVVTAASAVVFLVTASLTAAARPQDPPAHVAVAPSPASSPSPSPTPSSKPSTSPLPSPSPAAFDPDADEALISFRGAASTLADTSATAGQSALAVLATLEVKGRAAQTGYARVLFGQRWLDVDRNGCDTRNDILARDLTDATKSGPCKVIAGTLTDPYTGDVVAFVRGETTSPLVQIDHVVALSDAWQKGAQQLTADQRATFANDPLNLLAVGQRVNQQKGDGDAATWLPPDKSFRCTYVARQVSVKATYGLWVTQAEHDAIKRVLETCVDEAAGTSVFAPKPEPVPPIEAAPDQQGPVPFAAPVPAEPAPAPAPPASVYYANCTAAREAGAAPIYQGQPGYSSKLDRDGDGVACE